MLDYRYILLKFHARHLYKSTYERYTYYILYLLDLKCKGGKLLVCRIISLAGGEKWRAGGVVFIGGSADRATSLDADMVNIRGR